MNVQDKVIVVTGGGSGIGEGLCRGFASRGARAVVVSDVNAAAAKAVAADIKGAWFECDVRKEGEIAGLIDFAEERFGPIDLFCSNAGILLFGGVEVPNDDWQRIWEINVLSHAYVARALIPRMIERGGGAIMITASAAGLLSQIGSLPYSVTKHAAVGFAENLSITYGEQGIQVFLLCPQAVRTTMTKDLRKEWAVDVDGIIEPDQLADIVIDSLGRDEFLILPHPRVKVYMQRKTADYDRWLQGMRRLQVRSAQDRQSEKS